MKTATDAYYLHKQILKREERFAKGLRTQYALTHSSWGYPTLIYLKPHENQETHRVIRNIELKYQFNQVNFSFSIIRKVFRTYQTQSLIQDSKTQDARIKPITYQTRLDRAFDAAFLTPATLFKPVFLDTSKTQLKPISYEAPWRQSGIDFLTQVTLFKPVFLKTLSETESTTDSRYKRIFHRHDERYEPFRLRYSHKPVRSLSQYPFERPSGIEVLTPMTSFKPVFLKTLSETKSTTDSRYKRIFHRHDERYEPFRLRYTHKPVRSLSQYPFERPSGIEVLTPVTLFKPVFLNLKALSETPLKRDEQIPDELHKKSELRNPFKPLIRCTAIENQLKPINESTTDSRYKRIFHRHDERYEPFRLRYSHKPVRSLSQYPFERASGIEVLTPVTLFKPVFFNLKALSETPLKRDEQIPDELHKKSELSNPFKPLIRCTAIENPVQPITHQMGVDKQSGVSLLTPVIGKNSLSFINSLTHYHSKTPQSFAETTKIGPDKWPLTNRGQTKGEQTVNTDKASHSYTNIFYPNELLVPEKQKATPQDIFAPTSFNLTKGHLLTNIIFAKSPHSFKSGILSHGFGRQEHQRIMSQFMPPLGMLSKKVYITPQMILKTEKTHTEDRIINRYRDDTNLHYKKSALTNTHEINLSKQIDKQVAQKRDQNMAEFKKMISNDQSQLPINTVADQVYNMIERRIEIEKERRGFV